MNKKKVIAMVMSAVMLMPTTVLAKEGSHGKENNKQSIVQEQKDHSNKEKATKESKNTSEAEQKAVDKTEDKESNVHGKGNEKKQENQQKQEEKKAQMNTFKTEMKTKHEAMTQIRQQTIALKEQVEMKTTQISTIISDIEAGKKTLPQDLLDALLSKSENLKKDAVEVKSTSGVSSDAAAVQEKVNKRDFNNALSSLDKVIAKLQARADALTQLNKELDSMLEIANLATSPAPTPTPAPAPIPSDSTAPTNTDTTSNTTTGSDATSNGTTGNGTSSTSSTDSSATSPTQVQNAPAPIPLNN